MSFLSSIGVLLAVALVSAISGRLLVSVLPLRRARRCDALTAAATTVAGSMVWLLLAAVMSHLGLTEPRIVAIILIAHGVLAVWAFRLRRTHCLRPLGPAAGWAALAGLCVLAALTALLPVMLTDGFGLGYDNFTYCAAAEWLQDHPFSEPAGRPAVTPILGVVGRWQQGYLALGSSHALALLSAAGGRSAVVYPVASAWAFVLGALTVVIAARWALRLSLRWAWGAGFAFALLPHSGLWAQHHGFFAQTCGVPGLLLAVAAMGLPVRRGDPTGPVLIGLAAAYAVVVYFPFLPAIGAAGAVWLLGLACRRKGRSRRWRPAIVAPAVFLLAAGLELSLLSRALPGFVKATVGAMIPMVAGEWLDFAMGTRAYVGRQGFMDVVPFLSTFACVGAALLTIAGTRAALARPSSRGLLAAFLVFAALVIWYAGFVADPWTGRRGHTWSLFKAVQWSYPFLLLLQAAGAARVPPRLRPALTTIVVATLLVLSSVQPSWARRFGFTMRDAVLTESPLRDAARIRERFRSLPAGRLVLLGRPGSLSPLLAMSTALQAYPRPVALDWDGSHKYRCECEADDRAALERLGDPDLIFTAFGVAGITDAPIEPLAGGYVRLLEPGRPQLVQIIGPHPPAHSPQSGRPLLHLGPDRTRLVLVTARPCRARVVLARPPAEGPLRAAIQIVAGPAGGAAFRQAVRAAPVRDVTASAGAPLSFDVALERGQTTLVIALRDLAETGTASVGAVGVSVIEDQ